MAEKGFRLTDLKPTNASFFLSLPNRQFTLRPCTPQDIIELGEIGVDVEYVIKSPLANDLCRIALYLMVFEDAKEFKTQNVRKINVDTGEETEETLGGFKLLVKLIGSIKEQI